MAPDNIFLLALLYTTPLFAIPVPDNTNASGVTNPLPTIFIKVPDATIVLDAAVLFVPGLVLPSPS